jgi:hypothetical protein
MKLKTHLISVILFLAVWPAHAQGTFIYDQQSTNLIEGAVGIQSAQPMGQSFTPTLSSISFVMLNLYDGDFLHNSGATVYVNLRSDSISGTIINSTTPVFMPDGFFDVTNFFFSTPVAVTPGVTYYLQPVAQSGSDGFGSYVTDGSYLGGTAYNNGLAWPNHNLWFQEGIIAVPEPSSVVLGLLGFSGLMLRLLKNRQRQRF